MKINILLIFLLSICNPIFSQVTSNEIIHRKIFGTTPVRKNTTIHGISIGLCSLTYKNARILKIYGLNIEIAPLSAIGALYALGGTFSSLTPKLKDTINNSGLALVSKSDFIEQDKTMETSINGVSLSIGGDLSTSYIKGVTLNGLICFANQVKGVECTGIMNLHYSFKGLMIAGLRNKVTVGKGFQIGLINTCKEGKVVQIGLINRIGNRIIPFINFKLKKTKTNA